jgi:predicted dehydrogenase
VTKIVTAADIDKKKLQDFSNKWNVKNVYTDYKEMLKKENIDILSVCTNTSSHSEIVIYAAERGINCIFCEKPIASTLKEAEDMIKICKKNNVKLLINHTRRWDSNYQKINELLNSGLIGDVKSIIGYCPLGLLNNGTHLFDILRYFIGDVYSVFGKIIDTEIDPGGYGILIFKNKAYSFVDSTTKDFLIFEIDLHGSKGRIRISDNGRKSELWVARDSKNYTNIKELIPEKFPNSSNKRNSMIFAVEHLIGCIENDVNPICNGEDGKAALEIALAFHESNKKNIEVKLPLKNKKLSVKTSK